MASYTLVEDLAWGCLNVNGDANNGNRCNNNGTKHCNKMNTNMNGNHHINTSTITGDTTSTKYQ